LPEYCSRVGRKEAGGAGGVARPLLDNLAAARESRRNKVRVRDRGRVVVDPGAMGNRGQTVIAGDVADVEMWPDVVRKVRVSDCFEVQRRRAVMVARVVHSRDLVGRINRSVRGSVRGFRRGPEGVDFDEDIWLI